MSTIFSFLKLKFWPNTGGKKSSCFAGEGKKCHDRKASCFVDFSLHFHCSQSHDNQVNDTR